MNTPTAGLRSLAQRLVEHEIGPQPGARQVVFGAEAVCRKLAGRLEPLVGSSGFRVLLSRALHLASFESSLLRSVRAGTGSSGWLEGLGERVQGREAEEVRDATAAVLACSLRLLGHFIGDDLAVRIVSRAWPDIAPAHARSAFETDAARGLGDQTGERRPLLRAVGRAVGARYADARPADSVGDSARTDRLRRPSPARRPSALPHLREPEGPRARATAHDAGTASP